MVEVRGGEKLSRPLELVPPGGNSAKRFCSNGERLLEDGVVVGCAPKGVTRTNHSVLMEKFCILIVVVVTQIYTCDKMAHNAPPQHTYNKRVHVQSGTL